MSEWDLEQLRLAKVAEMWGLVAPVVRDGEIVLTGGVAAPVAMLDEIATDFSRFLACANAQDDARTVGFVSADYLRLIPEEDIFPPPDALPTQTIEPFPSVTLSQARRLPDGRIAVVWLIDLSIPEDSDFEYSPEPTPAGTVAIEGAVFIFVETEAGWRIDFTVPGEAFRLPLDWSPGATPAT